MRSRPSHDARVADLTRRRLAALTADLDAARAAARPATTAGSASPHAPAAAETAPQPSHASAAAARAERSEPTAPIGGSRGRHARRPVAVPRRARAWWADRLPAPLQERAHLGAAGIGLVCLVVAVGIAGATWALVRAAGAGAGPGEVVPPRPVASGVVAGPVAGSATPMPGAPTAASGPAATASASAPGAGSGAAAGAQIVVDVVGRVRRPGIVVLPAGARVVDAVRAAGGVRRGVRPTSVNMARLLTDGEQVAIGIPMAAGSQAGAVLSAPGATPAAGALVNLNTADQATLETLPGVGPVTAAAILQWRSEHGGFTSVDELLEVSGIGDATLAEIAPHVTL